jgi:hypothetical protein
MRSRTLFLALLVAAPLAAPLAAQQKTSLPAGLSAIKREDLTRDLEAMASDEMRGREAGTIDELRASMWVAEAARKAGLEPAGLDGGWFQWWSMRRIQQAASSRVTIGDHSLALWKDVIIRAPSEVSLDVPIVDADRAAAGERFDGTAVVATLVPVDANRWGSLKEYRDGSAGAARQAQALIARGAAAVILVADANTDKVFDYFASVAMRGSYGLDTVGAATRPRAVPPVFVMRLASGMLARTPGARLAAALRVDSYAYPSVNIIARVRGSDPKLRDEVILYSGHQDHDGVRYPVDGDSIWNGADDNVTTDVAMLAIGRAFVKQPPKRTVLFVWHGAEERGLLGSRWHAAHPVVPLGQIAAVINGDMIGRNSPDSASLLGSQPPHRNSLSLVQMAIDANKLVGKFVIDSTWDRPTHPEGFYFRSDHMPYARLNVPAIYFTTTLHSDYHTPRDEAKAIDQAKLTRMAQWMYLTGWMAANAPQRPPLDPGFKLER